jgi:hypothetical protein
MLTGMLQKEQASRESVTRRLLAIETQLSATHQENRRAPKQMSGAKPVKTEAEAAHRIKRSVAKRKPAPSTKRRKQNGARRLPTGPRPGVRVPIDR